MVTRRLAEWVSSGNCVDVAETGMSKTPKSPGAADTLRTVAVFGATFGAERGVTVIPLAGAIVRLNVPPRPLIGTIDTLEEPAPPAGRTSVGGVRTT